MVDTNAVRERDDAKDDFAVRLKSSAPPSDAAKTKKQSTNHVVMQRSCSM